MNKKRLWLAIIGAGMISREDHLHADLGSLRVKVTTIIDPMVEHANSMALEYGLKVTTAKDISEVFDQIDIAVIANPNDNNAAIMTAAEKSGAILAAGYSTRFRNNIVCLKELLHSPKVSYRPEYGQLQDMVSTPACAGW